MSLARNTVLYTNISLLEMWKAFNWWLKLLYSLADILKISPPWKQVPKGFISPTWSWQWGQNHSSTYGWLNANEADPYQPVAQPFEVCHWDQLANWKIFVLPYLLTYCVVSVQESSRDTPKNITGTRKTPSFEIFELPHFRILISASETKI